MTLGIDLGTSGVKAVLADADDDVIASADKAIAVSSPERGWSEQDPDIWCEAVTDCLDALKADHAATMADVKAMALSGQMLGAVVIDAAHRPLRPAILWNDQRAIAESRILLERVPDIGMRTNGAPDPGLTAPKLLWLQEHEPQVVECAAMLLLPKDYVRLWLTGDVSSEPSDASGTQLMCCATSRWDPDLVTAAHWRMDALPGVVAPWSRAGGLRRPLAQRWGLPDGLPVAAGCGDNMGGSLGMGVAAPADALITIGTSAVVCAVDETFRPAPQDAILTAPHAAPSAFLSMAVVMSATSAFAWAARLTGTTVAALAEEVGAFAASGGLRDAPIALPALTGVRTPHNRPDAEAVITGLTARHERAALGYAVLEGVAFQIRECVAAQRRAGLAPDRFRVVGGGTHNALWLRLIATLLDAELVLSGNAHVSAPIGAARLARVAVGEAAPNDLALKPPELSVVGPDPELAAVLSERFGRYEAMLRDIKMMPR